MAVSTELESVYSPVTGEPTIQLWYETKAILAGIEPSLHLIDSQAANRRRLEPFKHGRSVGYRALFCGVKARC